MIFPTAVGATLSSATFSAVLVLCAIYDIKFRRIPNAFIICSGLMLLLLTLSVDGIPGLISSLKGLGMGIAIGFLLGIMGLGGGGDMKLLGVCGIAVGYDTYSFFLLASTAALGPLALIYIIRRGVMATTLKRLLFVMRTGRLDVFVASSANPPITMPMALPICVGGVLTLLKDVF